MDPTSFIWGEVIAILQITHGAAACFLAIVKFARESLEMHCATSPRRWQLNRYMNLLLKQGILYFLVYVPSHLFPPFPSLPPKLANNPITNQTTCYSVFLFSLVNELAAWGNLTLAGWKLIVFAVVQYVPMFTLTPRFIMGIRELHARDVQGRRGGGIDTGFGLLSSSAGGILIMFTNVGQIELGDVEEIPMEVGMTRPK